MALLADVGIEYRPGHKPSSVDPVERRISFENGTELEYGILGAVPPHRAPKVVRDAGLADASGFVPVELGTFRTSAPDVYAVGDVAALKLPNGSPHPKAGVFAEAQALTVARHLAAAIAGAEKTPYAGRGTCFVDVGRAMAAPAEIDLLAEGGPQFRIDPPSSRGLDEKRKFETDRFERWFGG
jgi:sulfide:quinone oxidoreductase